VMHALIASSGKYADVCKQAAEIPPRG
jgi:hypothetical protein